MALHKAPSKLIREDLLTIRHSPEAKNSFGDPSAMFRVQGLEFRAYGCLGFLQHLYVSLGDQKGS